MSMNHFDETGNALMVDISGKEISARTALATGSIYLSAEVMEVIRSGSSKKGDVLGVARVAGIMAVKRTSELIPLCHPLFLTKCSIEFEFDEGKQLITAICTVKTDGKTGVEMEALTGVSVALLTIYDMCKSIDKRMRIDDLHLISKHGGKSGSFHYED